MSYTFDEALDQVAKAQIDLSTSTSVYLGLVLDGSGLSGSGQPSASNMAAITNKLECNYANYALKNVTGLTLYKDTTAHQERWTFSPITYTALGNSTVAVVGAWMQLHASTTTGRPLFYFDNGPLFPMHGGRDVVIASLTGGTVRLYG